MNHKTYLSQIKKLKQKLQKAIRTGSYKHYIKFKNEIYQFKQKNQPAALQNWIDEMKSSGKLPQDYSNTSIFSR